MADPIHEQAIARLRRRPKTSTEMRRSAERAPLGSGPRSRSRPTTTHKAFQKDAKRMAGDGWMPEQQMADRVGLPSWRMAVAHRTRASLQRRSKLQAAGQCTDGPTIAPSRRRRPGPSRGTLRMISIRSVRSGGLVAATLTTRNIVLMTRTATLSVGACSSAAGAGTPLSRRFHGPGGTIDTDVLCRSMGLPSLGNRRSHPSQPIVEGGVPGRVDGVLHRHGRLPGRRTRRRHRREGQPRPRCRR